MIHFTRGNLLEADTEALVNAVNTVGVMGKGIALAFRRAFPDDAAAYVRAARRGEVQVGRMFVTETRSRPGLRWIINFPTKRHWRDPSRLEWVRDGLVDLHRIVTTIGIGSIALPALGCGNGGLGWPAVRPLLEQFAASLPATEVQAYLPADVDPH